MLLSPPISPPNRHSMLRTIVASMGNRILRQGYFWTMWPKMLRKMARVKSTSMSRMPRNSSWKRNGSPSSIVLREAQQVLTEWMRE